MSLVKIVSLLSDQVHGHSGIFLNLLSSLFTFKSNKLDLKHAATKYGSV